ncbi:MAG: hypothetical protein R6U32_00845 [Candidatus Woesearchaeota archaeon]
MANEVEEGKACSALAYILIGIIWYFADEKMKKNSFAKFHTQQALVLLIAGIIFPLVYGIVYFILSVITLGIFAVIGWIGFFIPMIWAVIGIVYAVKGERKPLPVIGKYGAKLKI